LAAQAALTSSENRYARGAADILELLNQLTSLTDAQQERIRCLSEWRSARLRLMAHTGVMGSAALNLTQ
jgi:outer membrane protein